MMISNKMDFKTKLVTRDKEVYCILYTNTSRYKSYNTYTPNNKAPKYMKKN